MTVHRQLSVERKPELVTELERSIGAVSMARTACGEWKRPTLTTRRLDRVTCNGCQHSEPASDEARLAAKTRTALRAWAHWMRCSCAGCCQRQIEAIELTSEIVDALGEISGVECEGGAA